MNNHFLMVANNYHTQKFYIITALEQLPIVVSKEKKTSKAKAKSSSLIHFGEYTPTSQFPP
jgi:hypothetical protein